MGQPNRNRRVALLLVVVGILVALGAMFLVGAIIGDDSDGVDPKTGQVATLFLR